MIILIDIDDTIEDLRHSWIPAINRRFGYNVELSEITDWDLTKFFTGLTNEQIFSVVKEDGFWKSVRPNEGAVENVKKLIDDGHEVYLCSASHWDDVRPKFEDFVQVYFPFIDWSHVIICHSKQMINADILVDDGVHNLIGGNYTKILFTMPHNASFDEESGGMLRADSWNEVYRIISSL